MEKKWFLINYNISNIASYNKIEPLFMTDDDVLLLITSEITFLGKNLLGIYLHELTNTGQQLERKDLVEKVFQVSEQKV